MIRNFLRNVFRPLRFKYWIVGIRANECCSCFLTTIVRARRNPFRLLTRKNFTHLADGPFETREEAVAEFVRWENFYKSLQGEQDAKDKE